VSSDSIESWENVVADGSLACVIIILVWKPDSGSGDMENIISGLLGATSCSSSGSGTMGPDDL
jgi:hypothetical protein